MSDAPELDRLRRLRLARASGQVPVELMPWLLEVASAATTVAVNDFAQSTPAQRLGNRISIEVDRWMTRRRVNTRTISVPRSTLQRVLKGDNVAIETVADVADALGCEVFIEFRSRGAISGTKSTTS